MDLYRRVSRRDDGVRFGAHENQRMQWERQDSRHSKFFQRGSLPCHCFRAYFARDSQLVLLLEASEIAGELERVAGRL